MPHTPVRRDWLILASILGLAFLLRLPGLNGPLWYDEILTVTRHLRLDWGEMLSSYSMNFHYLHNLQAKATGDLWGGANWAIRLPSMIFGVAGVWAVWGLAWRISNPVAAHVTALLLAVSFHHIWFSQNARGYTELAFWGVIGTTLWLSGMARPTRAVWLGYGLTLTLATFTHLTGVFLFAAQGFLWLGVVFWQSLRGRVTRDMIIWPVAGYCLGAVLTSLLYLPVLPGMIETFGGVADTSAVDVMKEYQNPIWTVYEAIRTGIGTAGPAVAVVGAMVLVLALLGSFACRESGLFPAMVALHFLLTIVLLLALGMRIWPRFFFTDISFLLLLIVLGVQSICAFLAKMPGLRHFQNLIFPLAATGMLVISVGLAARNYMAPKQDLSGAVALISQARQPTERVYAVGPASAVFTDYFGTDWTPLESENDWNNALKEPGPFLIVVAFPGRMFRTIPDMDLAADDGRLTPVADLPGTLGDGHIAILRRSDG